VTTPVTVRALRSADRLAALALLTRSWGGTTVIALGTVYDAAELPGLVAVRAGELVGLLTYQLADAGLEVVTIDADPPRLGAGSALLTAAKDLGVRAGARRLWLVTTNDNLDALRFYQRRGLRVVRVSPGAVDVARELKPTIPTLGAYGIPLHDELTLEVQL
jgi:ribosomal protein S18 acetylase RimI-like enzyme